MYGRAGLRHERQIVAQNLSRYLKSLRNERKKKRKKERKKERKKDSKSKMKRAREKDRSSEKDDYLALDYLALD